MTSLLLDEYRLHEELGKGSFGRVLRCTSTVSHESYAVKVENCKKDRPRVLAKETETMVAMQGGAGMPKVYAAGKYMGESCVVMELLGPNLYTKFKDAGYTIPLKTVLEISVQVIDRLEFIHSRSFLHRDIKPQNFLLGRHKAKSTVHISDFGLAKRFQSGPMGMHVAYKEDKPFAGTTMFASLNAHLGIQQSRRDDIEAAAYMISYLIKGRLPWAMKTKNRTLKHAAARSMKFTLLPEEIFEGCSKWFARMLSYAKNLQFEEKPDYQWLKEMLKRAGEEKGIEIDGKLNWGKSSIQQVHSYETILPTVSKPRSHSPSTRAQTFRDNFLPSPARPKDLFLSTPAKALISSNNSVEEVSCSQQELEEETIKGKVGPRIDRDRLRMIACRG